MKDLENKRICVCTKDLEPVISCPFEDLSSIPGVTLALGVLPNSRSNEEILELLYREEYKVFLDELKPLKGTEENDYRI